MHAYYVNLLIELLNELGVKQETLFLEAKLDAKVIHELSNSSSNLNGAQLDALFSVALELSREPQLGLKLGSKINMVPHGILGYALTTSPTIGDALKLLVRYHRALLPSIRIELEQRVNNVALHLKTPGLTPVLSRFYNELVYAGILTAGAMLLGSNNTKDKQPPCVTFNYRAPNDISAYTSVFGPNLEFEQDICELCFHKDNLQEPMSTANSVAQQVFRQECERLMPSGAGPELVSEQVKRILLGTRQEFPTCVDVATQLHMSESTLRRQLGKEGWRFQGLLDQIRSTLAMQYLKETRMPISEIASLLGFSDSANFRRAFKRWSNKTPSELRHKEPSANVN